MTSTYDGHGEPFTVQPDYAGAAGGGWISGACTAPSTRSAPSTGAPAASWAGAGLAAVLGERAYMDGHRDGYRDGITDGRADAARAKPAPAVERTFLDGQRVGYRDGVTDGRADAARAEPGECRACAKPGYHPDTCPTVPVDDQVGIVGPDALAVIEAARGWRQARESGGMFFHNACRDLADAVDALELNR